MADKTGKHETARRRPLARKPGKPADPRRLPKARLGGQWVVPSPNARASPSLTVARSHRTRLAPTGACSADPIASHAGTTCG